MSLADRVAAAQQAHPDTVRPRPPHPRGFAPGAHYDPDTGLVDEAVAVVTGQIPAEETEWRDIVKTAVGVTIPDGRQLILTDTRLWGNPSAPQIYCRWIIRDRGAPTGPFSDPVDTLRRLRTGRRRRKPADTAGDAVLVVSFNDWQMYKTVGGGAPATLDRLDAAFTAVTDRAADLATIGRAAPRLVIVSGGDLVEGCAIYPHQPFEIHGDLRDQSNAVQTAILDALDRWAPHFTAIQVLAVGGNHGENRIDGTRVNRHDNLDLAVWESVMRAANRDPRLAHVSAVIARDEPAKTLDVNGWIVGTTHGHVFAKGVPGATPEQKALNWYQRMAAGRYPVGDSDVLITHHWHHRACRDWGACLWVQTPAMDGGSPVFADKSGQDAAPGMYSMVVTPGSRCRDEAIL